MEKYGMNTEGYPDPTATEAVEEVAALERKEGKFMPFVYICSRYAPDGRHTVEENEQAAIRYSRFAISKGYIPLVSHLLYPRILDDTCPKERTLGLFFGTVFLDLARQIWIFSDGSYSKGMQAEYRRAVKKGYKIRYFTEDLKEVRDARDRQGLLQGRI